MNCSTHSNNIPVQYSSLFLRAQNIFVHALRSGETHGYNIIILSIVRKLYKRFTIAFNGFLIEFEMVDSYVRQTRYLSYLLNTRGATCREKLYSKKPQSRTKSNILLGKKYFFLSLINPEQNSSCRPLMKTL